MRTYYNAHIPECGVSESIGFLLIFTIVIIGIGLVTLYGYPLLMQQQTGADEQIMEKNMIVLQNDVKSLAYKTIPYKETALKIGGGSLTVYNSLTTPATSKISICDANPCQDDLSYVYEFRSGDLRYQSVSAQTDLSLQNGAVVKRDRIVPGSVMLAEPRWFYDSTSNTMVINLIAINSTDVMARSGIGTVQMVLSESNYTYESPPPGNAVYLEYTPDTAEDYSTAWNNYFINTLGMEEDSTFGSTVRYRLPFTATPPPVLVIKKYDIMIKSL